MHRTEADKFSPLQPRNGDEDPALFRPGQLGLETDQIVHGFLPVFGTQLNDCVSLVPGVRIEQTDRFHGTETERFHTARRKLLHRHAPFKVNHLLKVTGRHLLATVQFIDERQVLFFIERTVEIIIAIPLTVPRSGKHLCHIHGFSGDNRRNGVVEVEAITGQVRQGERQGIAGQGTGGDDDDPFGWNGCCFTPLDADQRVGFHFGGNIVREQLAIDRQSAPGGDTRRPGSLHRQRSAAAQFLLEEPHGVIKRNTAQGVGADQFRQAGQLVGR